MCIPYLLWIVIPVSPLCKHGPAPSSGDTPRLSSKLAERALFLKPLAFATS